VILSILWLLLFLHNLYVRIDFSFKYKHVQTQLFQTLYQIFKVLNLIIIMIYNLILLFQLFCLLMRRKLRIFKQNLRSLIWNILEKNSLLFKFKLSIWISWIDEIILSWILLCSQQIKHLNTFFLHSLYKSNSFFKQVFHKFNTCQDSILMCWIVLN